MSDRGRRPDARRAAYFVSLRGYERSWLRGDLIAGLTLWAILVPQALAYASIAQRVAGRRPLRRARRAAAVRSARQLAGARRGPDGGRRGPVGGHGRRPGARRATSAFAALTAGLAMIGGRRRPDRGSAAPRLPGRVHQPSRAQGPDHRPRAHDHHRPAAEAVRDQRGARATSSSRPGTSSPISATRRALTLLVGTCSLAVILGLRRLAPGVPGPLVAVVGADRRGQGLRTRRPDGRVDRERPAVARPARHRARGLWPARRRRDRRDADRVRRGAGGGEGLRGSRRSADRRQP